MKNLNAISTILNEHIVNSFKPYPVRFLNKRLIQNFKSNFPFPEVIQVQTSNRCNLRCKICPTYGEYNLSKGGNLRKDDPDTRYLEPSFFELILKQISRFNKGLAKKILKLKPQLYDEPLLNPHIIEYIKMAKRSGIESVYFDTNGTLLTPELCEELVSSGLSHIAVSIDAASESVYRLVRRNNRFQHVREMVKYLVECRDNSNSKLDIEVSLVDTPDNHHEIDAFIKKWFPLVDCVRINKAFYSDGHVKEFYIPYNGPRLLCKVPWRIFTILLNGDVIKCMFDYNYKDVTGNIFESSILGIWGNDVYMSYRKKHVNGDFHEIDSCSNCDTWIRKGNVEIKNTENQLILESYQEKSVMKKNWKENARLHLYKYLFS